MIFVAVDALKFLRAQNVIHRDIKPQVRLSFTFSILPMTNDIDSTPTNKADACASTTRRISSCNQLKRQILLLDILSVFPYSRSLISDSLVGCPPNLSPKRSADHRTSPHAYSCVLS